ncbi:hypothetical protein PHJA_001489500 [Phtheirospermum japonicum]|uniref:Uncharacterized protein n=1 Tax=Phtheirospermum japonicum TaxID=374723 RepID=A0A830CGK4_9LAMI|nr:hypothetical protein PHJA_001489500 [Phtheirospermum japonicum]
MLYFYASSYLNSRIKNLPQRKELGESINISINTLPQEEKTQQADTTNEPCTVESENFLKTPSISKVHSEVNYTSSDANTEKPESSLIDADSSCMEHDEGSEKESEKMLVKEISTGKTNGNESAVDDKVKEDLCRAELLESTLPNKDLHVIPENRNETRSCSEEQSTNVNLHGVTSDVAEDKKIDIVDTQKEVLESEGSTNAVIQGVASEKTIDEVDILESSLKIGSHEKTKEKSTIDVDGSERKFEELPEKESEKTSSPQPLAREDSENESTEMHEARIEDVEPRKAELCETETSTKSMLQEIESTIEKPEDSLNAAFEDIKTSDSRSSFEESATAHPQDGKTDDKAVDADEIKEEIYEVQNVQTFVSTEKAEVNSLIQVDGPREKDKENSEKDSEKPSLLEDLGQEIESSSFEEQSATSHSQTILDQKTEKKALDAAETEDSLENVATIDSHEMTEENSSIQVGGPQKRNEEHLEKDIEKPSLGNKNLLECEKKPTTLLNEDLHVAPENSKSCNLGRDDETTSSLEEQSTEVNLHGITSDVTDVKITDAVNSQNEVPESCSIVSSNPEEGSTNVVLQGITNEKTIDEVDIQKQVLENSCSNVKTLEEKSTTEADHSETKNEELPEKESEKPSLPEPLERKASNNDEFIVMHEARIEDGEPRKAELGEIETSKRSMLPEIESKIEKPEDSLNVACEDIKTSNSKYEIETSSIEEQSATAHPQEGKTDDKELDEDEIKEEIHENVQPIVPNEKMEENSLIGSQKKDEENLEKDGEKPSLIKDCGQEIETSSFEEQSAHSQIILDQKTEDQALDAAETKEETLEVQNVLTCVSNEKTEENSLIQKENEEHLEKDIEKPSLIKDFTGNANADELTVTGEVKPEGVNSTELLENNKASDLGQHTEPTFFREDQSLTENPQGDQSLTANPQGAPSEKTEDETADAVDTNEKTKEQQNVVIEASNEDDDKNSIIQLDAPQTKHDTYLEKEIEKSSLMEASTKDINDESTVMHEAEISNEPIRKVGSFESGENKDSALLKKENLHEASEDHKPSVSHGDIVTTCSIDEQSLTENPQSIRSDKTSDVTETKEINLENVASEIPHEHTEENLVGQVDCSHTENEEHLGKESENLPLTETSVGETNDNESRLHEPKDRDENLIKAELLENERNTASSSVKEEAQVEKKHTDSSQAAPDDIKAPESTHDTDMSSTEEKILTAELQEISNDKKEETTDENNSLVEEDDGSDEHSSKEVSLEDNVSAVTHEATFVEEHLIKADLLEKEKREGTLVEEQVPIESPQVADEDIKASASCQDTVTSSIKEKISIADPQEISSEKIIDAAYTKEKALENVVIEVSNEDDKRKSSIQLDAPQTKQDTYLEKEIEKSPLMEASNEDINDESTIMHDAKIGNEPSASSENIETPCSIDEQSLTANPQSIMSNKTSDVTNTREINLEQVATKIPHEHIEENLAGYSQTENEKHLEKESENVFLTEASLEDTNVGTSKLHEPKDMDEDLIKAELLENERNTVSTLVKEEAQEEKHTDYLQAVPHMTEEKILSADPREISNANKEETSDDAADMKTQDIETNILDGDNENNSLIEEDGSDKHSSKVDKADDNVSAATYETTSIEEHSTKADLLEEEKHEGISVKEEAPIGSVQVSNEDIKASDLVQDREISSLEEQSLTTESQGIMGDNEDKTNDATIIEKESQNAATTTSYEDSEENSQTQVDVSQLEQSEHLKKESENTPPLTEASDRDTAENALAKEETEMEKPTDYVQVATEDIKASASCQDIETSSIKEQIPIADPQEIPSDKIEEKTIDAAYTKEKTLEDVMTKVSNRDTEDNLPKEASEGNANDNESITVHEVESVDENVTKANLFVNEKNIEYTSVEKEVVTESLQEADEDIKAFAQDRETISLVEQDQIMGDKEDKITEATKLKEQTPEEKNVATIPDKDSEENSLSQVDSSETEQKEHVKRESENAPLNASIEYFQIVTGDITASASGQDTEISSKEEQIPSADIQEISCDVAEEKTNDASYTREALIEDIVESRNMHEAKFEDENLIKAKLIESEKCTEGDLVTEKVPIDSLLIGADEIKASASSQERETSSLEVQSLTTNSQEITRNHNEQTIDATELKEETSQDKNTTIPIPSEDAEKSSVIQADCSQIERNKHLDEEIENPSLKEAQTRDTTASALLEEEPDIKASTSSRDTETCFIEEKIPTVDPQEITSDEIKERKVDVTDKEKETLGFQDIAKKIPSGQDEDNSPTEVDHSQKPPLTEASTGNATEEIEINIPSGDNEDNSATKVDGLHEPSLTEVSDYESKIMHEPRLEDESFQKADLVENEKNIDGALIKEGKSIESSQITTEASASGQDGETSSQEEQSLIANPQENVDNNREGETIDATDLKKETSKEKASESVAVEISSTKDSDVNRDTEVDIAEDHDCKQEESSITTASEEHMTVSNEHFANVTSSASEPSEQQQDIDKTDTEKTTVLDNGSTKIPTIENIVETDQQDSLKADAQVPDEENKAELKQQDNVAGLSEDVSESNKLNCEEEGINSKNLVDVSDSFNSVALEEVSSSNVASETDSTPNPSQESRTETRLEAENEEAQKQDEDDLHVSAPVQDSSIEKIEKDAELCPEITREMQKLEEAPLPDPYENTIRNRDCKESEVVEDAAGSFLNDKKFTEREHEETKCKQDNVILDETFEEIKEPASVVTVADDVVPKSFIETSEKDHSTANRQTGETRTGEDEETKLDKDKEAEACEPKITDFSSPAPDITEASDKDGANKSIAGVESIIDDEAPKIIHTAPSATESREVENISVGETSASISECERDGTEEKPDSNEFRFAPEESKIGYEAQHQVLESVDKVQCFKAEENLEAAAADIKSETIMVEDVIEPKEIKEEDEDVKNDHLGSCTEEPTTKSHPEDQPKQEEKMNSKEIIEIIKNANETEKVSKASEEEDDKALEEPEEKLLENESVDRSLHQIEQGKSVEDVTTISVTEEVRELDHSCITTGTQDSKEEVNSSSIEFLEDEDKSTDVIDNEMAKDEGLLNQISNTSVKDAVSSGEQPKIPDEHITCEAPRAHTAPRIIEDGEDKKDNADTILMQHQEEDNKSKPESDPLEKQDENDEIKVQTNDEVNLMLSAEKGEEEAKKEDTLSKPTEDEDKITYVEAEKSDKNQESQRQVDSLPILPIAKCSDIEVAEKDLPTEFSGLRADHTKNKNPENSVGNKNTTAIECELLKKPVLETEEATCEGEVKTGQETAKSTSQAQKNDEAEHEDAETGEEKDESSELCSEAPVMVDIGDADAKVAHKKSHNILSGVGSKVKHSIAKVKKAITGKSSHPKPPSPK